MRVMKTRDIHEAMKQEKPISYLMKKCNLPDAATVFSVIGKVSPAKAESFIRELKKKQPCDEVTANQENETNLPETFSEENQNQNPIFYTVDDEEVQNIATDDEKEETVVVDLEELKMQEEDLSSKVIQLEAEHKKLVAERRNLIGDLEKAQNALKELRRLLAFQEHNVTNLYDKYIECAEKMEKITQEKASQLAVLENVREQILCLRKITLLVYSDGSIESIESENAAKIPEIPDEEITSEFEKLIAYPEVGELTINEVKNVAKLKKIVVGFRSQECPFEVIFESTKVQTFWENVVENMTA